MFRYAVTIFLSAFLLFQVQPLIGKVILPWFGGGPAVWTTCMLFFQAALLGGYSYAHFITRKVSPRGQMLCHLALLIVSLAFLPIGPDDAWKPTGDEMPIWPILLLLTATIGLPYFLLSTTGPLLQEGYRRETGHPPYRLYALSNVGSLLGLLTYPFVFEPNFPLPTQTWGWSAGYVVFAAFCAWCAFGFTKSPHPSALSGESELTASGRSLVGEPTWSDILLWLALAACGSSMLLATTNQLCQEVSAVPFLWVLPFALYLTTFIICFDHERWYNHFDYFVLLAFGVLFRRVKLARSWKSSRIGFLVLLVVAVLAACYAIKEGTGLKLPYQVAIYSSTLWVCCMVCHGELVRSKPAAHFATLFYLMVSLGGVIGGLLVAVAAPLILRDFWEYQITLVATIVLAFFATTRPTSRVSASGEGRKASNAYATVSFIVLGGVLIVGFGLGLGYFVGQYMKSDSDGDDIVETTRNFYGVLHVKEHRDPLHVDDSSADNSDQANPAEQQVATQDLESWRTLIHGRIQHGMQFLADERKRWPTTYYGRNSGVGLAIEQHPRRSTGEPMRIGVVGLGTGTLAVYARPGDTVRFYEINPDVVRVSDQYFTYRKDAIDIGANVEIVLGDARIRMEREAEAGQKHEFDVLAIDAFSSDAIPMHLLTKESVALFREKLKPDGVLCMHISNRFLNLAPVVRGIAEALGYECMLVDSDGDFELAINHSSWVLLANGRKFLDQPAVQDNISDWDEDDPPPIVWTDDYASLWQIIDLN